jgi:hypothetical protein
MTPERFINYVRLNTTEAQWAMVQEKVIEGWKPFKIDGQVGRAVVYLSKPKYENSNLAINKAYCRIEYTGGVINYTPKGNR